MSFFDEQPARAYAELSDKQATYYREVLAIHANVPATGQCAVCHQPSCPDWRDAYDKLAAAGQVMAEPERWTGINVLQGGGWHGRQP